MPKTSRILIALALLAFVAYLPTLWQPLLEDDYPNIFHAHANGIHILTDPIFGIRSTCFLLMDTIYRLFGMAPAAYYAVLILLHILNTWLIYALGSGCAAGRHHVALRSDRAVAVSIRHRSE